MEIRDYSRQEMADIFNLNPKDKHFKRNLEKKLNNSGYEYIYTKNIITITKTPRTAEEKLKEILFNDFKIDIKLDVIGFAHFIYYLAYYEDYQSMPWPERKNVLVEDGINISERSLREWANKLTEAGIIAKDKQIKSCWLTYYSEGEKVRELVDGNEDLERDYRVYQMRKRDIFHNHLSELKNVPSAPQIAWERTFNDIWEEFHRCYYTCSTLTLNAIGDKAQEILKLVKQIKENEEL